MKIKPWILGTLFTGNGEQGAGGRGETDRQEGQKEAANLPWHVAIEIWEEQTPKDAFSLSV